MNTFNITVSPKLADAPDFEIEINNSTYSEADVLAELIDKMETDEIKGASDCDSFEVIDWGDVPKWAQDFETLEELMPHYAVGYYDLDVYEAAHEADIQFCDVEEAYSGEFDSDEAFAEDLAEQVGAIDKNASWPQTCIDWEQAAKELMYDYSEANGHYFRNL